MSLLDVDIKTCDGDVLLNMIKTYYQKFISQEFKIVSVVMMDILGHNMGFVDWDEIFNNPECWRVYYVQNIHTNWDMEVKFVPYEVPYVSGGRTVKEFIDGNIKPRYLL